MKTLRQERSACARSQPSYELGEPARRLLALDGLGRRTGNVTPKHERAPHAKAVAQPGPHEAGRHFLQEEMADGGHP
eukprot:1293457-Pleurochrysis_carterae.AAC.3